MAVSPKSGFNYDVFVGDRMIFDQVGEDLCPYSKTTLIGQDDFDRAIRTLLGPCPLRTYANPTGQILLGVFPEARVCGYHLARGIAAAAVEANCGFEGSEYAELRVPLSGLIVAVAHSASDKWAQNAQQWLHLFLAAAEHGGVRAFVSVWRANENENERGRRKRRRWSTR